MGEHECKWSGYMVIALRQEDMMGAWIKVTTAEAGEVFGF